MGARLFEGPGWSSEADGREAWAIDMALDKLLRSRRPPGHRLNSSEDREFERLMAERQRAGALGDLGRYREASAAIGRLALRSFEREQETAVEKRGRAR